MTTPQEAAFCRDCGAANANSAKTCWLCGGHHVVESQAPADSGAAMQAYRSPQAPPFIREGQNQVIFTLTLVVLGLSLLVVAIGILVEDDLIGLGVVFGLLSLAGLSIAWVANSRVRSQVRSLPTGPRIFLMILFIGTLCLLGLFIAFFTVCAAILFTL